MRSGGETKTIAEIFPQEDCELYTDKLSNAALLLSEAIGKNVEGIIGEIGFDLGLDKDGNVWLFEANSKPGRSIFSHPELKHFDLLTRKLSIAFAVFLTEQSILHPEEYSNGRRLRKEQAKGTSHWNIDSQEKGWEIAGNGALFIELQKKLITLNGISFIFTQDGVHELPLMDTCYFQKKIHGNG